MDVCGVWPVRELLLGAPRIEEILFIQGDGRRTRIILRFIHGVRIVIIIIVIKAELVAWTFDRFRVNPLTRIILQCISSARIVIIIIVIYKASVSRGRLWHACDPFEEVLVGAWYY